MQPTKIIIGTREIHLTKIYSTGFAFAALKADGSITAWGSDWGGSGAPDGNGYTKIYSNNAAFAIVKADGSITAWGSSEYGGTGAPSDNGYTKIYSNRLINLGIAITIGCTCASSTRITPRRD
jgi:alpha-tubulin suppressor-like RCC1 family protein